LRKKLDHGLVAARIDFGVCRNFLWPKPSVGQLKAGGKMVSGAD
jgi:hypothetical protein